MKYEFKLKQQVWYQKEVNKCYRGFIRSRRKSMGEQYYSFSSNILNVHADNISLSSGKLTVAE